MNRNEAREDISEEEFMNILRMGEIKMKRLTVGAHSRLDGIELKWTSLPGTVLIGPLVRKHEVILPDGGTRLKNGDDLVLFGTAKDLEETRELLLADGAIARVKRMVSRFISRMKGKSSVESVTDRDEEEEDVTGNPDRG